MVEAKILENGSLRLSTANGIEVTLDDITPENLELVSQALVELAAGFPVSQPYIEGCKAMGWL